MGLHDEKQKFKPQHRKIIGVLYLFVCVRACVFSLCSKPLTPRRWSVT